MSDQPALMVDYVARSSGEQATSDELDTWKQYDSGQGMRREIRHALFEEWFRDHASIPYDLLEQTSWRPPPDMQAAFDRFITEGWGERAMMDGRPRFVLRVHPFFERICFFEAWNHKGANGERNGVYYRLVSVFDGEPTEEKLPKDYQGKPHLAHLRGMVGEYRVPTAVDFEALTRDADHWRLTPEQILERCHAKEDERERDLDRLCNDAEMDWLEYNARRFIKDANNGVDAGWVTFSEPLPESESRYVERRVNGILIRARRGTLAADEIERAHAEETARRRADTDAKLSRLEAEARRRDLMRRAAGVAAQGGRTL